MYGLALVALPNVHVVPPVTLTPWTAPAELVHMTCVPSLVSAVG
jgi:hypothetical protein